MPLAPKPWQPSFGPLPRALAGRIPVAPAFLAALKRAADRHYIDERAAIAEEHDEDIARERAARLDETLNDAVEVARTGVLSPSAARLMEVMEKIDPDNKGGRHEDLAASADFPLNPAGKLLQLRPGQDVPVFSETVNWDSRRP